MITIVAHPIVDPAHVVQENFQSSAIARKWCNLLKRNNWKIISIEGVMQLNK